MAKKLIDLDKLPKNEQKVLIAKDVLNQLKAKKYKAHTGNYILSEDFTNCKINFNDDVKSNFTKIKQCRCCALGSMILSITKYKNNLTFNDLTDSWFYEGNNKREKLMKSVFTPSELYDIECCFEGSNNGERYAENLLGIKYRDTNEKMYNSYYETYKDENERLKKIMQNIIRNNGKFLPKQDLKD